MHSTLPKILRYSCKRSVALSIAILSTLIFSATAQSTNSYEDSLRRVILLSHDNIAKGPMPAWSFPKNVLL